ncbi:transcription factor that binds to CRE motif [Candidozyma auris]
MTVAVDPNFKSSLPPRKRARTQEEKEQRRVERILRNRRAAHASREKKRRHVEYLESYVLSMEANLAKLSDNFAAVCNLLPQDKIDSLNLPALQDLTSLKNQIHANMR